MRLATISDSAIEINLELSEVGRHRDEWLRGLDRFVLVGRLGAQCPHDFPGHRLTCRVAAPRDLLGDEFQVGF